ncbi:hypothetical protein [Ornithinimicrobium pratense]|uniref:Uncharacterized protein n=1 Tax=Ornithinimicrobium pratense TaxID=2593973 RepID=A0A5J6V1F6_9MICO|nr:hypothetical protein [Ornithinimicrobium pratense]QFG67398.1 hypothetical protein FY030_00465 [Ornithinimicrobium pratense]
MPYIDIEATRQAARRVVDAGTDVEGACRDSRCTDAAAELQGSRTLAALEPFRGLVDRRLWLVRGELRVVGTAMGELAERTATATGDAP